MILSAETLQELFELGAPPEKMARLLKLIDRDMQDFTPPVDDRVEAKRARDRERQQRLREEATSRDIARHRATPATSRDPLSPSEEPASSFNTENNQPLSHPPIAPRPLPNSGPKRARQATRLDPGWLPSEIEVAFAIREGLTPEEINRAADKFRDHWLGAPDSRGTKLDWTATWRNWVRSELDRRGGRTTRLASRPANTSGGGRSASSFADIYLRNHGSG